VCAKLERHRSHLRDPKKDHPEGQISVAQTLAENLFEPETMLSRDSMKRVFHKSLELFPHMAGISRIPRLTNNFLSPVCKNLPNPTTSFLAQTEATTKHL